MEIEGITIVQYERRKMGNNETERVPKKETSKSFV